MKETIERLQMMSVRQCEDAGFSAVEISVIAAALTAAEEYADAVRAFHAATKYTEAIVSRRTEAHKAFLAAFGVTK